MIVLTPPVGAPGFYEMTAAEYHADPCPIPSLSASIAKKLLRQTPKHAWAAHPRLCAQIPDDPTPAMLFGSVVHKLVLGAGARIKVIDAEDYRSKDAQRARDLALASGRLPILAKKFDEADLIAEHVRTRVQRAAPRMFTGRPELVAIWQEGDVWCRAMMDSYQLAGGLALIDDLKTSGQDISPLGVGKTIANMGYEIQAAFYSLASLRLAPDAMPTFRFAFAETEPPYEASIVELTGAAFEIGRRQVSAAIELWRRCLKSNEWPGYPDTPIRADLPPWHVGSWEQREQDDPLLEGVSY